MTQDEFAARIRSTQGSRVGRIIRSRMVVHSTRSNSSFKAYYAGDMWIAETWDPVAFLFPLLDPSVSSVVDGLLSHSLRSQFDYISAQFPSAVRLVSYSLHSMDAGLVESELIGQLRENAQRENSVSFLEFSGGVRIQTGGLLLIVLFLGELSMPVCEDEILVYCSDGALENCAIRSTLTDAKLHILIDENSV